MLIFHPNLLYLGQSAQGPLTAEDLYITLEAHNLIEKYHKRNFDDKNVRKSKFLHYFFDNFRQFKELPSVSNLILVSPKCSQSLILENRNRFGSSENNEIIRRKKHMKYLSEKKRTQKAKNLKNGEKRISIVIGFLKFCESDFKFNPETA